jgi:uncharacterized protein (DUF2235 family)
MRSQPRLSARHIRVCSGFVVGCLLAGCATLDVRHWPEPAAMADTSGPRHLFVFLDGTQNTGADRTNVFELFEMVKGLNDPSVRAIYVAGVGSADSPITGSILGRGMEHRMLLGYEFLARNHRVDDKIYIFGFSRGAHQARALAGFISYAGLPEVTDHNSERLHRVANRMLELTKKEKDSAPANIALWKSWAPKDAPPLAQKIREADGLKQPTRRARVTFLGVWDTVPGSFFKTLVPGACGFGETKNKQRYKSASYPPIQTIAHAVSVDEKRHKFRPLLVCDAMNEKLTTVHQSWFPGAHSDVGGGYGDPNGLPALSLKWMVDLLNADETLPDLTVADGQPLAPTHWSIGSFPGNFGSHCEDRNPPEGELHPSFQARKAAPTAPIIAHGERVDKRYPIKCSGRGKRLP